MSQKLGFPLFIFCLIVIFTTGCKSDYEKLRAGGDPKLMYKEAERYFKEKEWDKAQTLYELVIPSYRGQPESEGIYFNYAYTHYYQKKYILGSYYFENFSNTFPNSELREESDFMSSYANSKMSPSFRLDQSYTRKAIEGFQLFVNTYPTSERVKECNTLIDEMRKKLEAKGFDEAVLYYNLKQYQSATQSFENLLNDFPETSDAEEVRYLMVKSSYELATNSIVDKQSERFRAAISHYETFMTKHPKSKYKKEVKEIFQNSDKKLKELVKDGY